ncbi:MAG TPA: YggS family pyridoxal phosphate-dependent enzyme [Gemmatimonadales bacterium]|jgi:hypothetical protein
MPEPAFASHLDQIRSAIAAEQEAGGWTHPVRIIAVTKTHGAESVREAAAAGLGDVGENRVQEALAKQDACADVAVDWHLIGSLQQNKVRHAAGRFSLIHSVDRSELGAEIDRRTPSGMIQRVLVQVNCSGEAQKGGVTPDQLEPLLEAMRSMPHLTAVGLMTMAALTADVSTQRRTFGRLRTVRDAMQASGYMLPELSMGMSNDFEAAVAEGATMVRLGTLLFGVRA